MFLATERACGSKKHTARITMISLEGCPGHLRGWNGTTRRTEALTDTSRRQGTGRHPIPGCRSNCARRPDGLDGERARPRGHAAAEQRLTRPGPGGNPVCSSRAKVLVSTAYLRARPQKVAEKPALIWLGFAAQVQGSRALGGLAACKILEPFADSICSVS